MLNYTQALNEDKLYQDLQMRAINPIMKLMILLQILGFGLRIRRAIFRIRIFMNIQKAHPIILNPEKTLKVI